jgi:hypothetical protein
MKKPNLLILSGTVIGFSLLTVLLSQSPNRGRSAEVYVAEGASDGSSCKEVVEIIADNPPSGSCKISVSKSINTWVKGRNFRAMADVSGDGKADAIYFADDGIRVGLSNGRGFSADTVWTTGYTRNSGWRDQNDYPRALADVNGDGKMDVIGFGDKATYVSLSNGRAFIKPEIWADSYAKNKGGWTSQVDYPRMLADVNGDCMADIVGFGKSATYVSLSTGKLFQQPVEFTKEFTKDNGGWKNYIDLPRILADVNGDGKADIIGFGVRATYVALSNGSSFSESKSWTSEFSQKNGDWKNWDIYPRDMAYVSSNKANVIGFGASGTYVGLNNDGSSFSNASLVLKNFGTKAGGWDSQGKHTRFMSDVNGDGRDDIVGFGSKDIYVSLNNGGTNFSNPVSWRKL